MSAYASLLSRRGAAPLALACALGWLTFASLGLLIVLLVSSERGSFATAGLAMGGFSAAASGLAPLRGRAVDRFGPGALLLLATVHAGCLAAVLVSSRAQVPPVAVVVSAAAAGAAAPPLIATARALWPSIAGSELTRTAHAMTALLGDAALVVGPAAAGVLAATLGVGAAFGVLGLCPLLAAAIVVRLGRPLTHGRAASEGRGRALLRSAGMQTIVACGVMLGLTLGTLVVAVPAIARAAGHAGLSGLPLAAFAAGSVMASAWIGRMPRVADAGARYAVGFAILACVTLTWPFVHLTIGGLAATLLLAGGGYGLLNVAAFELLDHVVPPQRAVEALTWLTSAESLGIAIGGVLGGVLASGAGADALLVATVAAPVGAGIAFLRRTTVAGVA